MKPTYNPPAPTITVQMLTAAALGQFPEQDVDDVSLDYPKDAAQQIAHAYEEGFDAYLLARKLQDGDPKGWSAMRMEFLESLQDIDETVINHINALRRTWVEENKIEPPFAIGTRIAQGTIWSLHPIAGTYWVDATQPGDQHMHLIAVRFEDADSLEQDQATA